MIPLEYKRLVSPMKIGAQENVESYARTLVDGEEQLLITRDCKFYLTIGDGTYKEFPTINTGLTETQIKNLVNTLDKEMLDKINSTNQDILDLADMITLELLKYLTKEEHELKVKEIEDAIELEKHVNREVLDLFSESITGEPMYNGKTIIADFDTTNLVKQNELDSFKTEVNDSILILDNKINANKEEVVLDMSVIKTDIVDINKEITELREIAINIDESINDFSEHSSLPSFSNNPTISRIS